MVRLFNPRELVAANGDLLAASGMHNPRPLMKAQSRINDPELLLWVLPVERVPQPGDERLSEKFASFVNQHRTTLLYVPPEWKYQGFTPYDLPDGYVAIPLDRAIPLLVDQALLASEEAGAIPLTDDRAIAAYMIERFANLPAESTVSTSYASGEGVERIIFASIAMRVFTTIIDDSTLNQWSLQEVYSFRCDMAENLDRFRALLWQLTYELSHAPGEQDFQREIRGSVLTKIEQPLADLITDMRDISKSAVLAGGTEVAQKGLLAGAAAVPTLTVGALTGLSGGALVAGAATAAITTLGLSVPAIAKAIEQKKAVRRNSLFYLAKFTQ